MIGLRFAQMKDRIAGDCASQSAIFCLDCIAGRCVENDQFVIPEGLRII